MTADISLLHLERSDAELIYDSALAIPAPSREALGIVAARIGGGVVLAMREAPQRFWNKAAGFGFDEPVTSGLIGEICAFYQRLDAPMATLAVAPALLPEDWPDICAKYGIVDSGRSYLKHACLTGTAVTSLDAVRLDDELVVEQIDGGDAAYWAAVLVRTFGLDDRGVLEMFAGVVGREGWYPFAVRDGNEIVAGAVARVDGEVAYFSSAATLPKARNRGAQSALLAARVRTAARLACPWLVVETAGPASEDSPSLRNLRRFGFETMYERKHWTWRPAT